MRSIAHLGLAKGMAQRIRSGASARWIEPAPRILASAPMTLASGPMTLAADPMTLAEPMALAAAPRTGERERRCYIPPHQHGTVRRIGATESTRYPESMALRGTATGIRLGWASGRTSADRMALHKDGARRHGRWTRMPKHVVGCP